MATGALIYIYICINASVAMSAQASNVKRATPASLMKRKRRRKAFQESMKAPNEEEKAFQESSALDLSKHQSWESSPSLQRPADPAGSSGLKIEHIFNTASSRVELVLNPSSLQRLKYQQVVEQTCEHRPVPSSPTEMPET